MNKLFKLNKQEQGYSLAGVLIIFIVATVLGMSIVALSVNSMNISNKEHDDQSAYYIAESGTTYKVTQIESLIDSASIETENFIINEVEDPAGIHFGKTEEEIEEIVIEYFFDTLEGYTDFDQTFNYEAFEEIKGHQPKAEINLEPDVVYTADDNPRIYNILSEGEIDDESRTVQLPIEIKWNKKPEYALLTEKFINAGYGGTSNNYVIEGDIGVLDDASGSIKFDNGATDSLSGTIFVPDGDEDIVDPKPEPVRPIEPIEDSTELPALPEFPARPNDLIYPAPVDIGTYPVIKDGILDATRSQGNNFVLDLTQDTQNKGMILSEFNMGENNNVYINTGTTDRVLVIDDIDINGNILLVDNGPNTGKLSLFIENEMKFVGGSGTINKYHHIDSNLDGDISMINVYYSGTEDLSFGADHQIYASLYSNSETVEISFNAGGGFYGNILSNGPEITFEGGTVGEAQLILAPNAHINHENGIINGIVVAKEYTLDSGNLIYKDVNVEGDLSLEEIMRDSANAGNTFMQRPDPSLEKQSVREK